MPTSGKGLRKAVNPTTGLTELSTADKAVMGNSGVQISSGLTGFKMLLRNCYPKRKDLFMRRRPLVAPPTWTTATTYYPGQVVANTAATDWYICLASGSQASSVQPTGRNIRIVPDSGTAGPAWMWLCEALPLANNVDSQMVFTPPQSTQPAYAGSNRDISFLDTTYQYEGKRWATRGGIYKSLTGDIQFLSQYYNGDYFSKSQIAREIYTDSTFFTARNLVGMVLVDDIPVQLGELTPRVAGNYFAGVNFQSRRRRKITFVCGYATNVYLDANATIFPPPAYPPSSAPEPCGVWWGDSWALGETMTSPSAGSTALADMTQQLLGFGETGNTAYLGGSGLWKVQTGIYNYLRRMQESVAQGMYAKTDYITHHWIQGSVNDQVAASGSAADVTQPPSATQLTAQTLAVLQYARSISPNATLILSSISADNSTALCPRAVETNAAYKAGFDAFAATDSNCVWVDNSTTGYSGTAVYTSANTQFASGSIDSYAGTPAGNSSVPADTHPNIHGYAMDAYGKVQALYRALGLDLSV